MGFQKPWMPFTQSSDADAGSVTAVTGVAASIALATKGLYKIAAMGQPILWKLGAAAVTQATGSYLAAGDQEVIIADGATTLSVILSPEQALAGKVNVVPVQIRDLPLGLLRDYV